MKSLGTPAGTPVTHGVGVRVREVCNSKFKSQRNHLVFLFRFPGRGWKRERGLGLFLYTEMNEVINVIFKPCFLKPVLMKSNEDITVKILRNLRKYTVEYV